VQDEAGAKSVKWDELSALWQFSPLKKPFSGYSWSFSSLSRINS
jgi:hypothetical protein